MITVVLSVCLIAQPMKCKDIQIPVLEVDEKMLTPWKCAHHGQLQAVKWIKTHPKYQIKRYKCVPEKRKQFDI